MRIRRLGVSAVAAYLAEASAGGSSSISSGRGSAVLRPGLGPPHGAHYLQEALRHYDARSAETDPRRRAELLLLANVEIGYHEQIRIQPEIEAAIQAAVPDAELLRSRILTVLFPGGHAWIRVRTRFWSLLASIDPTPDSLSGTGVKDWADLGQRVHYIVDLFRCHQETPGLLSPPHDPAGVERIMAGRYPDDGPDPTDGPFHGPRPGLDGRPD